ncbi:adenylate kinase [Haloferula sargassicola]|uniref:Adenylate kinase n=2 Tax=Haloferula sargassicola TaxID=490096 RepID=A0ABP9UNW6_9BACT
MPLRLVLLGPPASGKGTQGRRIAEREGLAYLSTGALLREELENEGPIAEEIRPVLARGGYVADDTMCRIMEPWLASHESAGWVLDGFPRTAAQDDFLGRWLDERGQSVDAAVALEVPQSELLGRIERRVECPQCRWSGQKSETDGGHCPKCGAVAGPRADDGRENFLRRFDEFALHALPVIERYARREKLIRCDATDDIGTVADRLARYIDSLSSHGQEA